MVVSDAMLRLIDAAGVLAFAISGIRMAGKKDYDIFGAFVIGYVTAIGGGTLRDLLLGKTPVWMQDSIYILLTFVAVLFVMVFRKNLIKLEVPFFIFDTLGLALFNVVGIEKTLVCGFPWWVAITMGMITGAAGGIIRDVLLSQEPLIFKKEIYATACIFGGLVFFVSDFLFNDVLVSSLLCASSVVALRVLALKYGLSIPKLWNNK